MDQKRSSAKVAVIGSGPAALSCAYYLTLAGYEVSMFTQDAQPGGKLWERSASDPVLRTAVLRDIQGMMANGISFRQITAGRESLHPIEILKDYGAVFITDPIAKDSLEKDNGRAFAPGVFIGDDFLASGTNVVKAAATGRSQAVAISQYLDNQPPLLGHA